MLKVTNCTFVYHSDSESLQLRTDEKNDNNDDIQFKRANNKYRKTKQGKLRYKTKQFYKNIPIFGASIVVEEDEKETTTPILGKYYKTKDIEKYITNVEPLIDKDTALEMVQKSINLMEHDIEINDINNDDIDQYKSDLFIYKHENKLYLSWFVETVQETIIIDANNGEILGKHPHFMDSEEICGDGGNEISGSYRYCEDKAALEINNIPYLSNEYVTIYDSLHCSNIKAIKSAEIVQCIYNSTTDEYQVDDDAINGAYCVACDAFYFATSTFNLYDEWLNGTLPINEEDIPFPVVIHYSIDYANAAYSDYYKLIIFGDGGSMLHPLVVLDIVAHEIGHGFTSSDIGSKLVYLGESGGINEAYSDLIGEVAKYYVNGENNWKCGCDIIKETDSCLRYFSDPLSDKRSIEHYKDDFFECIDVHFSSGIYNKAWYLLNNDYGWSMQQLFQIVSNAQLYWTEESTFNEGLCGIQEALCDIYGNGTETDKMRNDLNAAFEQVGVKCIIYPKEIDDNDEIMEININNLYVLSGGKASWHHFYFNATDLNLTSNVLSSIYTEKQVMISTSGGFGDADMYISLDEVIPSIEYDCISHHASNEESCYLQIDDIISIFSSNIVYVSLYGFDAFNDAELSIEIVEKYRSIQIETNKVYNISQEKSSQYYSFEIEESLLNIDNIDINIEIKGGKQDEYQHLIYLYAEHEQLPFTQSVYSSSPSCWRYDCGAYILPGSTCDAYAECHIWSGKEGTYYFIIYSAVPFYDVQLLIDVVVTYSNMTTMEPSISEVLSNATTMETSELCICESIDDPICCGNTIYDNECSAKCDKQDLIQCNYGLCQTVLCDQCKMDKIKPVCCNNIEYINLCTAQCNNGQSKILCNDGLCNHNTIYSHISLFDGFNINTILLLIILLSIITLMVIIYRKSNPNKNKIYQ